MAQIGKTGLRRIGSYTPAEAQRRLVWVVSQARLVCRSLVFSLFSVDVGCQSYGKGKIDY